MESGERKLSWMELRVGRNWTTGVSPVSHDQGSECTLATATRGTFMGSRDREVCGTNRPPNPTLLVELHLLLTKRFNSQAKELYRAVSIPFAPVLLARAPEYIHRLASLSLFQITLVVQTSSFQQCPPSQCRGFRAVSSFVRQLLPRPIACGPG